MHGLLKVVHGKVDISVYTKTTIHDPSEIPPFLKDRTHLIDQGFVFPTTKEVLKSVTSEHEAVILSPGNFHIEVFGKCSLTPSINYFKN